MLVKTFCAEVTGLEATTVTIEVNLTRGMMFHLSGLADTAVKESYDRIRAAVANIGHLRPTLPSISVLLTSGKRAVDTTCRWLSAFLRPMGRLATCCSRTT